MEPIKPREPPYHILIADDFKPVRDQVAEFFACVYQDTPHEMYMAHNVQSANCHVPKPSRGISLLPTLTVSI